MSVVLGTVVLVAMPLMRQVQAQTQAEELACPAEFDGIELSEDQQMQLLALEEQFDEQLEAIMPMTPEAEAQVDQLEDSYDQQVSALLSPEQEQQVEQLDAWAESQVAGIAPELLASDTEPELSEEQEAALETLEDAYDLTFSSILTPETQQQVSLLEEQMDEELEATMPELTAEQIASIEAAEADYEMGVMQVLTPEQQQQLESNLACSEF